MVVSTFYALQDTKTPVKVAIFTLLANIVFSISLMGPMRHAGLALATSLSSILNLAILLWFLKKRLGHIGAGNILKSVSISSAASIVMGLTIVWFLSHVALEGDTDPIRLMIYVGLSVAGGIAIYGGLSRILKSKELAAVVGMLRKP